MVDAQNVASSESTPDPVGAPGTTPEPSTAGRTQVRRVPVRRAPNVVAFVLTGAVLGFILGALVNQFGPIGTTTGGSASALAQALRYSNTTALFYLGTVGLLLGAGAGALVAVLLDRRR